MPEVPPILLAGLTGFISGLLQCIPVGPINLTIINEGARRGFGWAAMTGLGAVAGEIVYCGIAFTSFASLLDQRYVKAAMELVSFIFMLYLGMRFLLARRIPSNPKIEERIERKIHPHSAFWIGFIRVIGNPGVLLFWGILAANFISRGWVTPDFQGKTSCTIGVALGVGLWFLCLSYAMSLGHGRFTERTLLKIEHGSGITLLCIAAAHGVHIIWQMARHPL